MPKLVPPTTKNSPKVTIGKNRDNKPAEAYAPPHTMSGKKVSGDLPYEAGAKVMEELNPSAGGISKGNYKPVKTDGIKIRGTGAATKGVMARGPMA
jgi:hypothetical protein